MSAAASLPPAARRRALDLLGIQRYRARGAEPPAVVVPPPEPATPPPRADAPHPPAIRRAPPQTPVPATAPSLLDSLPLQARVVFVLDAGAIEEAPWSGRYARLLAQLTAALGLGRHQVGFDAAIAGVQRIYFGASPGDDADALLAPPLAGLRASAAAKKSLWRELRRVRRTLARRG
jgi:hypothetical protein